MKPVNNIVFIGHNSFVFDTPRLLHNRGREFSNQLQEMKVLFTDNLPLIKFIRSQPNNVMKSLSNNKLGSVYEALFNCEFPAHDTLEDVKEMEEFCFPCHLKQALKLYLIAEKHIY